MSKPTKRQKFLAKKFGAFRKRQAAQRARFAKIREEIKSALERFEDASHELSVGKLLAETRKIREINARTLKRAVKKTKVG